MSETDADETPSSAERLAQATRDLIDRRIGERMVEFADHLDGLGFDAGTLTATDLISQLRQQGESLRTTGRHSAPEPD
jgi:hypothetical protein